MDIRPSYSEELMVKILRKSSLVSLIKVEICQCVVKGCQVIVVRRPFMVSLRFPRGVPWMDSICRNNAQVCLDSGGAPHLALPGGGPYTQQAAQVLTYRLLGNLIEAIERCQLFTYHQKVSNYNPHMHHL